MASFYVGGNVQKKNYFEGWYYKNVTIDKQVTIAIIPGIACTDHDKHAFIQIIENKTNQTHYIKFDFEDFQYHEKNQCIQIGDNYFYPDYIDIDIKTKDITLNGFLYYSELTPLSKNKSIMGPFAHFPGLECHHEIISLHHYIDGILTLNGEAIDFEDGIGYLEKDYGTSFPETYEWFQSNHLAKENLDYKKICVFFSIADVPLYFTKIKGFIASILINDKEYRFATYNGAKALKINKKGHIVKYTFKKRQDRLILIIKSKNPLPLISPEKGNMKNNVYESLDTECQVTFYHKKKILLKQKLTSCAYEQNETVPK